MLSNNLEGPLSRLALPRRSIAILSQKFSLRHVGNYSPTFPAVSRNLHIPFIISEIFEQDGAQLLRFRNRSRGGATSVRCCKPRSSKLLKLSNRLAIPPIRKFYTLAFTSRPDFTAIASIDDERHHWNKRSRTRRLRLRDYSLSQACDLK